MKTQIRAKQQPVERHSPVGRSDYLSLQHIARYQFAKNHLRPGQRVLDIACGTGYGTAILISFGCDVVGADYDTGAVDRARCTWDYDHFVSANALELPFPDNEFDAVVTLETIEHVEASQVTLFLQEIRRVLKPGGVLICSTPNIRYSFHPAYHLYEFQPEEFFKLVEAVFSESERYAQYFRRIDRLRDLYLRKLLSPPTMRAIGYLQDFAARFLPEPYVGRLVLGDHRDALKPPPKVDLNEWLNAAVAANPTHRYRVRPYKGEKFCRIMVVKAHASL